ATRMNIARFLPDGTLDSSFDAGEMANNDVYALTVQLDGQLLVGGAFIGTDALPRNGIMRLNTDGTVDTSFNPGKGTDDEVFTIIYQDDPNPLKRRIYIGGLF